MNRLKSVMKHRFSNVANVDIPRSTFKRDHGYKTTFDAGYLVPILVDFVYPGDTFNVNCNANVRLSTPVFPTMDNLFLDTFFFAIPERLVWENFQKFMGERDNPADSIDYTLPIISSDSGGYDNESIFDYMGLPTKVLDSFEHRADFLRAYNLVYNQWFRDQNLQDSVTVNVDDGPDAHTDYELLRRCKRHDYFTSCLPDLQKGDAVELSLGISAPVYGENMDFDNVNDASNRVNVLDAPSGSLRSIVGSGAGGYIYGANFASGTGALTTDLANATAGTVNQLRQAVQVQRILEKDMRAGTRYTEIIESHFGVTSDDARLQRPEYLGGGSQPITIVPVSRTDSSPGELGAIGFCEVRRNGFIKSFTEHCIIIGLVNVRADLTYQEGLERMWSDQTRFDLYLPALAHLGEQAVLNKEIYIDAATIGAGTSEDVFGYQERYAHLRYKPSKITGKFRSNDAGSLDAYHLGIEFGSQPTLDDTFIVDDPPIDRIIATPTEPHFIFDSFISMDCTRPLPTYAIPGYVDHF